MAVRIKINFEIEIDEDFIINLLNSKAEPAEKEPAEKSEDFEEEIEDEDFEEDLDDWENSSHEKRKERVRRRRKNTYVHKEADARRERVIYNSLWKRDWEECYPTTKKEGRKVKKKHKDHIKLVKWGVKKGTVPPVWTYQPWKS